MWSSQRRSYRSRWKHTHESCKMTFCLHFFPIECVDGKIMLFVSMVGWVRLAALVRSYGWAYVAITYAIVDWNFHDIASDWVRMWCRIRYWHACHSPGLNTIMCGTDPAKYRCTSIGIARRMEIFKLLRKTKTKQKKHHHAIGAIVSSTQSQPTHQYSGDQHCRVSFEMIYSSVYIAFSQLKVVAVLITHSTCSNHILQYSPLASSYLSL